MARFQTLIGLGLASTMMIAAPVFASTPPASTTTAAKPAAHTPAKRAVPARKKAHMAKTTLSNGKKVTYDCSLAGNKNKQACKG